MSDIFRKEGPWAWLCTVAAFVAFFIIGGTERSFGIWYVEILENFGENAAVSSLISGVNSGIRNILSPLASAMFHKWPSNYVAMSGGLIYGSAVFASAWVTNEVLLLLTYGVIGGFGSSLTFLAAFKAISDYFDKYKGIALALVQTGFGFGAICTSIVYSYLFNNLSYFESVTIIAGICLQYMVIGAIFMPRPEIEDIDVHIPSEANGCSNSFSNPSYETLTDMPSAKQESIPLISKPTSKVDTTTTQSRLHFDLLKIPIVWTITISSLVYLWCGYPYILLIVDFAVERGFSEELSNIIVTISSSVEFVLRFFIGLLIQHRVMANYRYHFWSLMCFLGGVTAFVTPFCTKLSDFILAASALQTFTSGFYACGPTLISLDYEESVVADVISFLFLGFGVGMTTGSLLSGALRDWTGSYAVSYFAMGSAAFVSTIPFLITPYLIKRSGRNKKWYLKQ